MSRAGLRSLNGYYAAQNTERLARLRMEAAAEPFRVTYRYVGDRPGMTYTLRAATPRELVKQLTNAVRVGHIEIVRLFEVP